MAGFALVAPGNAVIPGPIIGNFTVKNGEIINNGDPVGIDSSGYVVCASKTQSAIVKAVGFAIMVDDSSGGTAAFVTGDVSTNPNNPVKVGICRHCIVRGVNSTLVPSLGAGLPVYLGPVGASAGTVSALTCALTSTNGDAIQELGFVLPNGVDLWLEVSPQNGFKYQTAGNSTLTFA